MGMLCHLLGIVATVMAGGLGFLGPLVIWLIKKDQSAYIDFHGKEALNFHLTVLLVIGGGSVVAFVLSFILIGLLLLPVIAILAIVALVFMIIACVAAQRGEWYRYPGNIRFIR